MSSTAAIATQVVSPPPRPLALFVGTYLPPSETFVFDQLRLQQRFRAHVFARRRVASAERFPYPLVTALAAHEEAELFLTGRSRAFARDFQALEPALVHAHFGLNGVIALPYARAHGVPLVVSFHGHDVPALFPERGFSLRYARYRRMAGELFDHASRLLCASSELAELLVHEAHAPAHKIVVHRLGVDLKRFAPSRPRANGFRVLMVGRMVEKKGMEHGVRAFARLLASEPTARLAIVGDGPLRARLVRAIDALGIAGAVELKGALSPAAVASELAASSVLLAPSVVARDGDRESGMLVVKEAGAASLPVVASRHGGIPEIVEHGRTGFLCEERDVVDLARRLQQLAASHELRRELGSAARRKIEREYDARVQHARLEQILERACD